MKLRTHTHTHSNISKSVALDDEQVDTGHSTRSTPLNRGIKRRRPNRVGEQAKLEIT